MPETNSQRIAKNTGFLFIRTLLVLIVGLYTSRVILRTLGFEDFGIYNVVGSVVIFFSFLRNALTNATYRYLAYEIGVGDVWQLRRVYSMAINCHWILAAGMWLLLEASGMWFIGHRLNIDPERMSAAKWAFQFSLLTFCASIVQTPYNSNIVAHERMNFYAFVSVFEVLLKLAVAFLIVRSPFDKLISYAALLFLVSVAVLLIYAVYCRLVFKECRRIRFWDGSLGRQFVSYSGWSLLVNAADVTAAQSISIFFNIFIGTLANSALGIANQVNSHLNSFLNTFTQAFNPQIIKSYAAKNYGYFMQLIYSTSKISYFLLLFISVPVLVNIHFVLKVWLGAYPEMAPIFIQMIVIYSLTDAFQCPLWQAVHATGNLKVHQILMSSIKFLAIPGVYILLKTGHSGAAALSLWAGLNLVCAIVRTLYMHFLIGLDIQRYVKQVVLKIVAVTLVAVPVPYCLVYYMGSSWKSFLISSASSVLLTGTAAFFYGLDQQEKRIFLEMPIVKKIMNLRQSKS